MGKNVKLFEDFDKVNEGHEDEIQEEEGKYTSRDGWDEGALEGVGLIDFLDKAQALSYEVKNCRRGSYVVDGDTAEDLIRALKSLRDDLDEVIENME